MNQNLIYCDANATFPMDSSHVQKVFHLLSSYDGNPSSIHAYGRRAKIALEDARMAVAKLAGVSDQEIMFTSGATESNNLVVNGCVQSFWSKQHVGDDQETIRNDKPHIIVSAVEHSSVLEPVKVLAERGLCEFSLAPVDETGTIQSEPLLELIKPSTILIALIHGQNEVGTLQPIAELAADIRKTGFQGHIHIDAVQSFGKVDFDWVAPGQVDSFSMSAHKIGGFKGCGALYLKRGRKLALLLAGGGQERSRRPGTENLPGIFSFGLRCEELLESKSHKDQWRMLMRAKLDAFLKAMQDCPGLVIHGKPFDSEKSLPNTLHFHIEGVPGDDLLLNLDLEGICASSGSACSSGAVRPSHVVQAMGYNEWIALNSVRISFGADGALDDVEKVADVIKRTAARMQSSAG